jgi:DNA-binding beta-propeller fold protein YncE
VTVIPRRHPVRFFENARSRTSVPARRPRLAACLLLFAVTACGPGIRADAASETLIVLNKQAATAWLIDPVSGEVRARLDVGEGPHEAAVSPDGRTAVVCNYGAGAGGTTLTVLDVPGARVVKTISLAPHARPHGIHFLADGRHVLVTSETSRALLRVDVAAGAVAAVIDIGVDAHLLAVSGDESRAYGAGVRRGAVGAAVLGGEKGPPRVRETGPGTEAIAIRPGHEELWVGSNDLDRVTVLDPATLETLAEIDCGLTPIRLAFTPDGRRALASCAVSGDLVVIDAERRRIERRIPLSDVFLREEDWKGKGPEQVRPAAERVAREGARPIGVLVAPGGAHAYVACNARDEIAVVAIESGVVVRRLATGAGPDGMAWSRID